jgi:hypothetical protein
MSNRGDGFRVEPCPVCGSRHCGGHRPEPAAPGPLEARLAATTLAVENRARELERELPAMTPERVDAARRAAIPLGTAAASVCRMLEAHWLATRPSPAETLGDPDHREPGEEP